MKRLIPILLLTVFLWTGFSSLIYCQKDSVTVGFILASTFNDRWLKDRDYFIEKFNELGGKVVVADCFDQVDNQIQAAKDMVEKGVDGIIIVAIDAVASAPAVEIAHKAGIPVIAYDRIILNAPIDYYVSFNSVEVGEFMANTVVNNIAKGNILYVGGPTEDYNSKLVRQGVFNVLEPLNKKYKLNSIKASTWNQMDAYLVLQDYLTNEDEMPDAIICAADVLVRGVMEVLMENNAIGSVIVTGQDAELEICKMIVKGEVEMTVYKPIEKLGDVASKIMWNSIKKKKVETNTMFNNEYRDIPSYLLTPIVVNKENIDKTIIEDDYYTKEQIYGE
jgi:ABC-type xylose transport system substrate-binding protein